MSDHTCNSNRTDSRRTFDLNSGEYVTMTNYWCDICGDHQRTETS